MADQKPPRVVRPDVSSFFATPLGRWAASRRSSSSLALAPHLFGPYATVILTNALLYTVLALGLNIVVGYAGLLDLGYAAFFAVGAYTVGILTTTFGISFWLALPVAVLMAALAGVIIGAPTLRLRSDYLAIVTLGFGEIVRFSARNLEITGKASGISGIQQPWLFGWHIARPIDFYYVFCVLAILAVIASVRLANSRLGRAWLYVRHDEDAAEAMGINRVRGQARRLRDRRDLRRDRRRLLRHQPRGHLAGELLLRAVGADPDGGDPRRHGQDPGRHPRRLHRHPRAGAPARLRRPTGCCSSPSALLLIMLFRPSGIWPGRSAR